MVAELENPVPYADPREQKTYYTKMTPFRQVATPLVLGTFRGFAEVEITGSEKVPESGAVILAANHLTNFDVLPLQMAIASRPIFYMGKEELFRNPVSDWVLRQMGGFPVYRGGGDDWAMHQAAKVLEHGQVLGIFPEGTRSRGKGLAPAKTGAARLALDHGCPILPVAIHGPEHMFKRFPRRTTVHINIGDPVLPLPGESALNLTDRLMFALAAMLPAEQRGAYSFRPKGF